MDGWQGYLRASRIDGGKAMKRIIFAVISLFLVIISCAPAIRPQEGVGIPADRSPAMDYINMGFASLARGEYGRAIEAFNQAISLDPKLTIAYAARANAYQIQKSGVRHK